MKEGKKFDTGKPRWSLLPFREIEQIVDVLTLGSIKYCDNNWKKVKNARDRYFSALQRHLIAWWTGERLDKETSRSHLAHAACCLLFLMWFDNKGVRNVSISESKKIREQDDKQWNMACKYASSTSKQHIENTTSIYKHSKKSNRFI